MRARMTELAEAGASLNQIRAHLALPEPEGFGLDVSRVSIYKRLEAAGIKLKNESIAVKAQTPALSPEALAVARREVSAEDLAKHKAPKRGRLESWLAQFVREIHELDAEGYAYRGIWDVLAARYPVVPQFSEPLTDKQKTDRLAVFIRRQRKKNESRPKARRLFEARSTLNIERDSAAAPAPASSQVAERPQATKARASLPVGGTNVVQRQQELADVAEVNRAAVPPEELEAVQRRHGVKR